jgi:hypothetical protein
MARKTYTTEQIIGISREVEVRLAKRVGIASYANIVVNRWTQLVRGINCPSAREPERSSQKERRRSAATSAFGSLLCPGEGMPGGRALHEGWRSVARLLRLLPPAAQRVTSHTLDGGLVAHAARSFVG